MGGIPFSSIGQRLCVAWVLALAAPWVGADEMDTHEASFSLYAPQASSVEIIGDFNQWQHGATPLAGPDETGRWKTTLRLPGSWTRIEYVYWVNNLSRQVNTEQPIVSDGFFGENNIVILP